MHTLTLGSDVADNDWSPLKDETLAFRIDFQVNALEIAPSTKCQRSGRWGMLDVARTLRDADQHQRSGI